MIHNAKCYHSDCDEDDFAVHGCDRGPCPECSGPDDYALKAAREWHHATPSREPDIQELAAIIRKHAALWFTDISCGCIHYPADYQGERD